MELKLLFAMASAIAGGACSPIVAHDLRRDETLPFNPGGPMKTATDTQMTVNPGGLMNPPSEPTTPTPMPFNPGGPIIPAPTTSPSIDPVRPSTSSSSSDITLPFNPGGYMSPGLPPETVSTPMPINPGGPAAGTPSPARPVSMNSGGPSKSTSTSRNVPAPFNPGGPFIPAPPLTSTFTRMTVNPGGPTHTPGQTDSDSGSSGAARIFPPPPPPSFTLGLPPGFTPPPLQTQPPPPPPFPFPPFPYAPSCKRVPHMTHPFVLLNYPQAGATRRSFADSVSNLHSVTNTLVMPSFVTSPGGCTMTTTQTAPTPCEWHGTITKYSSTTTMYQGIHCHGCTDVYVHRQIYFCPMEAINATETAITPSTQWSTTCLASTTFIPVAKPTSLEGPDPAITAAPRYNPDATGLNKRGNGVYEDVPFPPDWGYDDLPDGCACPTTLFVRAPQTAGRTSTCYSKWTTTTKRINCGGCPLVVLTVLQGFGPVAHFTKTTTLALGTATAYACSAT